MSGACTGCIIRYSADTLQQTGVVNVAANWRVRISIYMEDDNDTFDTTSDTNGLRVDNDQGNSFMQLSTNPLKVTDDVGSRSWTAFSVQARRRIRPTALNLLRTVLQRIAAQHENWRRLACFWRAALPRRDMLD
jgi:hypothetical protein